MDAPNVKPATGLTITPPFTLTPNPDVLREYSAVKCLNPVWNNCGFEVSSEYELYSVNQMFCIVTLKPTKTISSKFPDALKMKS